MIESPTRLQYHHCRGFFKLCGPHEYYLFYLSHGYINGYLMSRLERVPMQSHILGHTCRHLLPWLSINPDKEFVTTK